ncbi:MAG: hypothetical protein ACU84J_07605 [Gammaproteobacteria bacterium]
MKVSTGIYPANKRPLGAAVGLAALLTATAADAADVGIGVFTHYQSYLEEQTVDLWISGFNNGAAPETVDVHVGVFAPDGLIYEYPNWNTDLQPWLPSFTIPANFHLPATFLDTISNFPGGLTPGVYRLAVALTLPGTLELLSFTTVPISIDSANGLPTFGSTVLGYGVSAQSTFPPLVNSVGVFLEVNADSAELKAKFDQTEASIDQCLYTDIPGELEKLVGAENISFLDAGPSLNVSASAVGSITLLRTVSDDDVITYNINPTPDISFYQPGEKYKVSGTGGPDIAAFSISAAAPEAVVLSEPDLAAIQAVTSASDMQFRWQGHDGVGEINISLAASFASDTISPRIVCRFADDGEGTIPAGLLAQLKAAISAHSPSNANANLSVWRANIEIVDILDEDTASFALLNTLSANVKVE